jgi:predicted alpha/beta-hydrolase family hydrolase
MPDRSRLPSLTVLPATRRPTALVLILHGGRARGRGADTRLRLTYRRMLPFARALHQRGAPHGVTVWLLHYRYRGWNAPDNDALADAGWALAQIRERHPGVPVVLLGHSMGGRAAFHVADDDAVRAVCALAPWTEQAEPVAALAGRTLVIAHGDRERMTDPSSSLSFATRALGTAGAVARFEVHGDGHAMLRRATDWTELVVGFCLGVLGVEPMPDYLANALCDASAESLRVPLPHAYSRGSPSALLPSSERPGGE